MVAAINGQQFIQQIRGIPANTPALERARQIAALINDTFGLGNANRAQVYTDTCQRLDALLRSTNAADRNLATEILTAMNNNLGAPQIPPPAMPNFDQLLGVRAQLSRAFFGQFIQNVGWNGNGWGQYANWLYMINQQALNRFAGTRIQTSNQTAQAMIDRSLQIYTQRNNLNLEQIRGNNNQLGRHTALAMFQVSNYGGGNAVGNNQWMDAREYVEALTLHVQQMRANGASEEDVNQYRQGFYQGMTEVMIEGERHTPGFAQGFMNAVVQSDTTLNCSQLGSQGQQIFEENNLGFANYARQHAVLNGRHLLPQGGGAIFGGYIGNGFSQFVIQNGQVVRNRHIAANENQQIHFVMQGQTSTTYAGGLPFVVAAPRA